MKIKYSRKKMLASVVSCLIVGASWGQTTFNFTGNIETYTVPTGITQISIEAFGAQGGNTNGGLGAKIYGEFTVTPGQVLNVLVGEQGTVNNCGGANSSGGGGGASFVWDPSNATLPLIAAGGGGGGNTNYTGPNLDGVDGQSTQAGTGGANGMTAPGTVGNGGLGNGPSGAGAGGAGWNSAGDNSTWSSPSLGGQSLPNFIGGTGSPQFAPGGDGGDGGFGGGGGATCGCGGGAGYSGGSGGEGSTTRAGGGGGGSYNSGTNVINTTGVKSGNGQIIITPIPTLTTSITVQGQGGVSTISIDNGTLQMEATVLPTNVTDGMYVWSVVNGTGSATINSAGILTALTNGNVTVVATANDASGVTGSAVIAITNQASVGINESDLSELNIYPNPSTGLLMVNTNYKIEKIVIYNISGEKVLEVKGTNKLNISDLEEGIYFIKMTLDNAQIITKKVIKI